MTDHDERRMKLALNTDLDNFSEVMNACLALQSTDDPSLVPLWELFCKRFLVLKDKAKQ